MMRIIASQGPWRLAVGAMLITIFISCAGAPRSEKQTSAVSGGAIAEDGRPKTLAILPFENNSVTDAEQYAPLSRGLAAMLITDLNKNGSTLKLIERSKIDALLKEIALGQGGGVDQSTAVQVGRILGAQSIAFGSFMVLGSEVRIDVRIVKVETSELIVSESINGGSEGFMDLENQLAGKIAESLKVAFQPKAAAEESGLDAALYFSRGLESLDSGDRAKAQEFFAKCVAMDAAYAQQVEKALEDAK